MPATKQNNLPSLESSLSEIHSLVEQMEKGDLTLEQSLSHFERGITLIKHAQKMLLEAEQKVSLLMKNNDNNSLSTDETNPE